MLVSNFSRIWHSDSYIHTHLNFRVRKYMYNLCEMKKWLFLVSLIGCLPSLVKSIIDKILNLSLFIQWYNYMKRFQFVCFQECWLHYEIFGISHALLNNLTKRSFKTQNVVWIKSDHILAVCKWKGITGKQFSLCSIHSDIGSRYVPSSQHFISRKS